MNRFRRLCRRTAMAAAAVAMGVAGAAALPGSAGAEQAAVSSSCTWDSQTDEWVVSWTVTGAENQPYRLQDVTAAPEGVDGIHATDGDGFPHQGELTGVQRLPGNTGTATLEITLKYEDGSSSGSAEVQLPDGCEAPELPSRIGDWTVTCDTLAITIENPTDEDVALTFAPSDGNPVDVEVAGGESATVQFTTAAGLSVDVLYHTWSIVDPEQPITVTSKQWEELECEGGAATNGSGGGLPATGAPVVLITLGAVTLLGLGAGLFLVARRRRIRFTA